MNGLEKCLKGASSYSIDKDEFINLINKKNDKEAREKLVLANLKLVAKVVLDMKRMYFFSSVSVEDMFQEGVIGLMKAIDNFEPKKGSFSHYAYLSIRRHIELFVFFKDKLIRFPKNEIVLEILRFEEDYYKKHGRKPRIEDIMKNFKIDKYTLIKILNLSSYSLVSLESKTDETENLILEEKIGENNEEKIEAEIKNDSSPSWMSLLNEKEKLVIQLRYGFLGDCKSLEEIAKNLGRTRERVRQIESTALNKISSHIKNLSHQ